MEVFGGGANVPNGARAHWEIDAPSGLVIVGVHTEGSGMVSYGVNQNMGWGGGFYWAGGGAQTSAGEVAYSSPPLFSSYFGWQIICGWSTCDGTAKPGEISILGLEIEGAEASGPSVSVAPGSLGATSGWVRGTWPIAFSADGPTGACQLSASLDGTSVSQPLNEPQSQTTWHQCPAGSFSQPFNTAAVASGGSAPLVMWARDAAYDYGAGHYLSAAVTSNVNIDNDPVGVSLSGPTDAPSTAGTQYINATATAGPSGVAGIFCSTDGSPYSEHAGASAQIPVEGIGSHTVSCYAQNNAMDTSGAPARSAVAEWTTTIREASLSTVSFARVVDTLRCSRVRERVHIAPRWVTGTAGGKPVRVRLPAETRTVTVVRCHPVVVHRRVLVHGHWRIERVVLLPHTVRVSTKSIPHGASTEISGWLGTIAGNALANRTVVIQTAPDNGLGEFANATATRTAANGSWTATLGPGPSRLVRVVYGGDAVDEPSLSPTARLVVPAALRLSIAPRRTHWGSRIRLSGRVLGGYVPASGELVVLWIGWNGGSTEIGHLYTDRNGRFRSSYTFLRGNGSETYRLWAASVKESDYPFAPARSRSTTVDVNP